MKQYLKRNKIALIAVALLLPAYILRVAPQYQDHRDPPHYPADSVVPLGHSAEINGIRWKVRDILRENRMRGQYGTTVSPPDGAEIIRVVLTRDPIPDVPARLPNHCLVRLIQGDSRWEPQDMYGIGSISIPNPPKGSTKSCDRPGSFTPALLAPKNLEPEAVDLVTWLELGDPHEKPTVTRFLLR